MTCPAEGKEKEKLGKKEKGGLVIGGLDREHLTMEHTDDVWVKEASQFSFITENISTIQC